jgi:hypothetical protein
VCQNQTTDITKDRLQGFYRPSQPHSGLFRRRPGPRSDPSVAITQSSRWLSALQFGRLVFNNDDFQRSREFASDIAQVLRRLPFRWAIKPIVFVRIKNSITIAPATMTPQGR